ncbi:phosphoglycerate mutase-like protein [Byssothecium circinans]|uniref:Phosphoglycerate mutase-like protein n=1 Tax=Byssothecium circinans TaxID=147558 RepID=A0A6A5TDR6_9PLEO|nr:phosphoglycerate mutase-like protein [Byssothecium circinans]
MTTPAPPLITLIRHGESLHNIQRPYPHRDPPLTAAGQTATSNTTITPLPDLIVISPMTRTLQTAINMFPDLQGPNPPSIPVQIWPDLCETYDAECNKGSPRAEIAAAFPQFDFAECSEVWDYPGYSFAEATARAERVRKRLKGLTEEGKYRNIAVVTHRGIIAFLAKGRRFGVCERRVFRFATEVEVDDVGLRWGTNCESLGEQDFGPSVLVLWKKKEGWEVASDGF